MRTESSTNQATLCYTEVCMPKKVLFICTGNYYRSRFAEAVFNHYAELRNVPWRAFSRGLAIHKVPEGLNLSGNTRRGLSGRGIDLRHTTEFRIQISPEDFSHADYIVALKEAEHRPMIMEHFPEWESHITFWDVSDLPDQCADNALPEIEAQVLRLLETLISQEELG